MSVQETDDTEAIETQKIQELHSRGITGSGVRVGILSCGGFDTSQSDIYDQIAATTSYVDRGLSNGGINAHGTAVAEIVAEVAPNSSLYLVNYATADGLAAAVDWLEQQNVDVVAHSCGWYSQPDDGTGYISTQIQELTDEAVVANSAGNKAKAHIEQGFRDPDQDNFHEFSNSRELAQILDSSGNNTVLERGTVVSVELQWDQWPTDTDVTVALYRKTSSGRFELVEKSGPEQYSNAFPVDELRYRVPEAGQYFIAIHSSEIAGGDVVEVTLTRDGLRFKRPVPRSSIMAPAVADGVTAVGAHYWEGTDRSGYSSIGPDDGGDRGVDLLAPSGVSNSQYGRFYGTSASAPHVAGVAALVLDANASLSPTQVQQILYQTADSQVQPNVRTGYGQLNATRAVEQAATPTSAPRVTGSPATDTDDDGRYEDVNGDGTATVGDVLSLYRNLDTTAVKQNVSAFDFNGDGSVSLADVLALFRELN